ncbi:MAG: M28 family peptidase [Clostridiales bacterium]|nr:M28 family peptidase [Clostridiales bacterium]
MNRRTAMQRIGRGAVCVLLAAAMATGCAGPSTAVLPRQDVSPSRQTSGEPSTLDAVDLFYMQKELENLTSASRPSGSRQESDTAKNIEARLAGFGYDVTRQRFRYEQKDGVVSGSNVIAIRSGGSQDSDIIILCTHHDTSEYGVGANDDASGVVVLLEAARLLSGISTDTELRLISFAGHEQELLGSRHYTQTLSRREKERIIGVIDLDQLGYVSCPDVMLGTIDGRSTMLGDMLLDASRSVLESSWRYGVAFGGDASSFLRSRIPAVTLTQPERSYENGTPYDLASTIDVERLSQIVNVVCQTVSRVMSPDTPSMTAKSHAQNDLRQEIFSQGVGLALYFGEDLEKTESRVGLEGRLVAEGVDEEGNPTQTYQFRMKWFGFDCVIPTEYYFVNGVLRAVELDGEGAGVSFDEMRTLLSGRYGDSQGEDSGPTGTEYAWIDRVYRRQITLTEASDGFYARITEYEPGKTVLEIREPDGSLVGSACDDQRVKRMLSLVQSVLPDDDIGLVSNLTFYTDGVGGSAGEALPAVREHVAVDSGAEAPGEEEDRSELEPEQQTGGWELWIDLDDAMDESGSFRDRVSTVQLLIGLCAEMQRDTYGEAFETAFGATPEAGDTDPTDEAEAGDEDGTEEEGASAAGSSEEAEGIDASSGDSGEASGEDEIAGVEEADETALADRSIPEWDSQTKQDVPSEYTTSDSSSLPDFVESFRLFVLAGSHESGMEAWDSRVGFFGRYEELNAYRRQVRIALGLDTDTDEQETEEAAEMEPTVEAESEAGT